jgi:ABC-2 type transport system permease protein
VNPTTGFAGIGALTRLEVRRVLRNRRVMFFSLIYPVVLFLIIGKQGSGAYGGVSSYAVYLMLGMATFGSIGPSLNNNAIRIAQERKEGWTRQLRLTSLPGTGYVVSKVLASCVVTIPSIGIVFLAGALVQHVHLSASGWLVSGVTIWVGTLIFAALAVVIGYALPHDTVQLVTMIIYLAMSFLGGLWFTVSGAWQDVAKALPTYQVNQVSRDVISHRSVGVTGYLVLAVWLVAAAALAAWVFRRDSQSA